MRKGSVEEIKRSSRIGYRWTGLKAHSKTAIVSAEREKGLICGTAGNKADSTAEPVIFIPVEMFTDLNNDGKIDWSDAALVGKPYKDGATEQEIAVGTEHVRQRPYFQWGV
jgi:hypothetical protein